PARAQPRRHHLRLRQHDAPARVGQRRAERHLRIRRQREPDEPERRKLHLHPGQHDGNGDRRGDDHIYGYDGYNLRRLKTTAGASHYYVHGPGGRLVGEYAEACPSTASALHDYVYAGSRLLAILDPALPVARVGTAAASVNENAGSVQVAVTLATADGCPTRSAGSVAYPTPDGKAVGSTTPGVGDYTSVSGTLSFAAGTASGTTRTIDIPIVNDHQIEPNETFSFRLSNPSGLTLGTSTETITIIDNDTPVVSFV